MPYRGTLRITRTEWLSSHAIGVRFHSAETTYLHQLYAGRTLIGVTPDTLSRQVTGQLQPTAWPQYLTLLAVTPANRLTDYGAGFPPRPYNRVKLQFDLTDTDEDAQLIEVTAGTEPAGAVDPANVIAREFFDVPRTYSILTPPLPGSGLWNLSIAARDHRPPNGNLGTPLTAAANILATPPDLQSTANGNRFAVSIEDQQATLTFTLPT